MEKYLYFRSNATIAEDDDETNGSTVYPVSSFRGAVSGTSTALGVVTDDLDALSLYFTPKGMTTGFGDADGAAGDNVDVVVVAAVVVVLWLLWLWLLLFLLLLLLLLLFDSNSIMYPIFRRHN